MTRRLPRLGSLIAIAAGVLLVVQPTAHAQDTTTSTPPASSVPAGSTPDGGGQAVESWALSPAGNRPNLSYTAFAGGEIKDQVILANYGNVPLNLEVYATDAFNNDQGKFDVLPAAQKPVDVGTWVTFPQDRFTVMPRKQLVIPITIHVPAAATVGDHVGGVLASAKAIGTGPSGNKVLLDRRTGTRIYLRVNGPDTGSGVGGITPHLSITSLAVDYHHSINPFGGSATVKYRVQNDGNVRLSGTQKVTVEGPFGLGSTSLSLDDMPEILPGQHFDATATLHGVPAYFLLDGSVHIQPKGATDLGTIPVVTASASAFAPPISLLLVVLVAIIVVLVLRARRRTAMLATGGAAAVGEHQRV